ncbi:hypothetical protein [Bradyrhizobium sp. RDM4]|uniref:hypothetical protein n=1 Tax=Bradyrhizobium sp. RDM4 TaxID=3378765 RepID=UPI0038FC6043
MPSYITGPLREYPGFFAYSPVLLVEALQTAIDRLPRAAQSFAASSAVAPSRRSANNFASSPSDHGRVIVRSFAIGCPTGNHAVFSARAV